VTATGADVAQVFNAALNDVTQNHVVVLDATCILRRHALLEAARAFHANPDLQWLYSDEDRIDADDRRSNPYFKPDWNPELLASGNYIGAFAAFRTGSLQRADGLRAGFADPWHALYLRCAECVPDAAISHIPSILWHRVGPAPAVADVAGAEAVRQYMRSQSPDADIAVQPQPDGGYRVQWALPQPTPKISLIIPTRDRLELLKPCVRSILERTTWPDYEIVIVDNGSTEARTRVWLADIACDARVRILDYNQPFNYSAINNVAVRGCEGELVCLLNNDVEVITPDWLQEMAGYALQDGVGAVGAMLYYPNNTIQHAGVVLGMHGVADHRYAGRTRGFRGQGSRGRRAQNLSAVTGACLMVRRPVYEQAGGLNEFLTVAFNDVDFCLRLRARGYRNVWTPWAELYHHESASRGRDESPRRKARYAAEIGYMREHWPRMIEADPAWNRNLSLADPDDCLAFPPREAAPMADRRLAPAVRPAPAVPARGRS
jgi:GT2 family glycosyltransferase